MGEYADDEIDRLLNEHMDDLDDLDMDSADRPDFGSYEKISESPRHYRKTPAKEPPCEK